MSTPNPLVAQAPAEPSGFFNAGTGDNGWATGFSIADSAVDAYKGISEGSWIEGGLGVVGLAADAASMAIDPFGTLLSSAASFLMEHMQPLKEALDWLAGDPPVIESYSTTWGNVSQELGKIAADYKAAVDGTAEWTGAAADAYRKSSGEQLDALSGAASTAGSVGTVVGVMGMVVGFVREMVRDLIADLVAKLITWVLEAVFTLGFGTPVIVAQAVTAISKWATRIGELIQKLIKTIKKVSPLLGRLVEIFTKIMKVVGKLVGKVTGLDVISTKSIKPGGFFQRPGDVDLTPSGSPGSPSSSSSPSSSTPDGSPSSPSSPSSSPSSPSSPDSSPSSPSSPSSSPSSPSSSSTPDAPSPSRAPDASSPSSAPSPSRTPDSSPDSPSPSRTPDSSSPDSPSRTPDSASSPSSARTPDSSPPSPGAPHTASAPSSPSSPSSPDAPAPRSTGQTVQSSVAPPEAPARPDVPNAPSRTPDGSPSATPSQAAPMGGAPNAGGGGAPSSPAAGRPQTGGQGWTGTPGSRGDLGTSAPAPRSPDMSTSAARADAPARPGSMPTAPSAPSGGMPSGATPSGGMPSGGMPSGGAPSGGMPHGPSGGAPSAGAPHSPSASTPNAARPDATPPSRATAPSAAAPHAPSAPSTPNMPPAGTPHAPSAGTPHGPSAPNTPHSPNTPSAPTHRPDAPQGRPNTPHNGPFGGPNGGPNAPHGGPNTPHSGPNAPFRQDAPHGPNAPHNGPNAPSRPDAPHGPNTPSRPDSPYNGTTAPSSRPDTPHSPNAPHNGPNAPSRPDAPHGGPNTPSRPDAFSTPHNGPHARPDAPHGGPHSPSRPDAPHRPDGSGPGNRPDSTRPDGSRPDGSRPDGTRPDGSRPDGSRPDGSRPDGARPHSPEGARPRGTDTAQAPHRTPDAPDGTRPDAPHHGPDADRPGDTTPDRPHDGDADTPDNDAPNSNDAPPADRPSPEEAHARHAESTPAGVSHHGGDSDMGDLPHRVPDDPRFFTADVHITPDGRARIGGHDYTPDEYADMLRRSGYDGSRPVRLIGCDAGSNDFAQQLSRNLDAPVVAPTRPAWTDTNGRVFSSDAEIRPDGTREPRIPPNGEWETHHPDGSRTRASEDGFAPGSHDKDTDLDPTDARDRAASPDNQYEAPPTRDRVDESSDDFDERFVDYDRPGHNDPNSSHYHRDPNPPDDLGSPRDIDAPARDRVRDAPGPPRAVEDVPTVPEPLRDHALPPDHTSLPPNTQFNVSNANGTRTTFFTDADGNVKWVEATSGSKSGATDGKHGFNPDLDYPLMGDVQYRVNDQWDFHTNERGQTDSVSGTPSYGKSDGNLRDDSGDYSAQGRAGAEGKAAYEGTEYEHVKWAGGHIVANEAGGPGEYINMFGQMNASNSGHNRDGFSNTATWRAEEAELAKFARQSPNHAVADYQVRMTRREDGLPPTVEMRYTKVVYNADGTVASSEVYKKTFKNVPEITNYAPHTPYGG